MRVDSCILDDVRLGSLSSDFCISSRRLQGEIYRQIPSLPGVISETMIGGEERRGLRIRGKVSSGGKREVDRRKRREVIRIEERYSLKEPILCGNGVLPYHIVFERKEMTPAGSSTARNHV